MLWFGLASGARALELPDSAILSRETRSDFATLALPVTPWSENGIERVSADGVVTRRAYRVPRTGLTTLQAAGPIRRTLEAEGYQVLFDCGARACGGFDFRYSLNLLPEPEMHVDLGDFRYFAARRSNPDELVGIVISRGAGDLYVHEARVSKAAPLPVTQTATAAPRKPASPDVNTAPEPARSVFADRTDDTLSERLESDGHVVLADLEFATGSAALEPRTFASLVELAEWLNATPGAEIVLVGHSDAIGGLEANFALSRQRAQSVADRLIAAHGVAPGQVRAEGIGYLAPLASNATEEGRAANRRVEVVLAALP